MGKKFSYAGFFDENRSPAAKSQANIALILVGQSFDECMSKYLTGIKTGQLAGGLDVFYSNLRNREIFVKDATWIVLKIIAGTPSAQIETMIENYRK